MFATDGDRLAFRACLLEASVKHGLAIHGHVFMTNHVHLLATGLHPRSTSLTMQDVGRKYVQRVNWRWGRSGGLWDGRHRNILVESDRHALNVQRYIDENPVRAGLVRHPAAYLWSSHLCLAFGRPDDLVTPHATYLALGADPAERQKRYAELFASPMAASLLEEIRQAECSGWVLGSDEFVARLESASGRRLRRWSLRGRPRKPGSGLILPKMGSDPIFEEPTVQVVGQGTARSWEPV